jgi:hypothetical protein
MLSWVLAASTSTQTAPANPVDAHLERAWAERDRSAEEQQTRCEGTTKAVIEVETGRVIPSEGKGRLTVYFRNTAENGAKQEVKLQLDVEGKSSLK